MGMKYKDPNTGQLKELSVKAADTLPIGSIVDYDGETVPDGWEEVEDSIFKILWTNPSPTATFASQSVTLSSDDYDYLMVSYTIDTDVIETEIIPKGKGCELTRVVYDNGFFLYKRRMTYTDDKHYLFSSATLNGDERNWLCIPYQIVGIKLK